METRTFVPEEYRGVTRVEGFTPLWVENPYDRPEVAEPQTLLTLARIVGLRANSNGKLT